MARTTLIHTAGVRLALAERRHPARRERRRRAWQRLTQRAGELQATAVLVAGDLLGVTRLTGSELAEVEQLLAPLRESGVALLVAPSPAERSSDWRGAAPANPPPTRQPVRSRSLPFSCFPSFPLTFTSHK